MIRSTGTFGFQIDFFLMKPSRESNCIVYGFIFRKKQKEKT